MPTPDQVRRLALEMSLPIWLARLLVARGIQTAEQAHKFLSPSLQDLHSPYLMTGLRAAVERCAPRLSAARLCSSTATTTLTAPPPSSS
jgi:single-stranded-DNA-specific exonuclease